MHHLMTTILYFFHVSIVGKCAQKDLAFAANAMMSAIAPNC